MVGEHIHWFFTDKCNDNCAGCFREIFPYKLDKRRNSYLARILADSPVEKVTIGGGEPTLVSNLPEVVDTLKDAGKYVRLHTNGKLLEGMLDELNVDSIALPIDTVGETVQEEFQGKIFRNPYHRLENLASSILEGGIELGWHTVFTAINYKEIPEIYKFIKDIGFDYWTIFEFNDDLALTNARNAGYTYEEYETRFRKIELLRDLGTPTKGLYRLFIWKFSFNRKRNEKTWR